MKRALLLLCLLGSLLSNFYAFGDEGMWLYNAFPKDKVKAKYGFEPSQQWLDHVRLSSVRFNNGGSGSFVSTDGLTFTNHHVGAECLSQLGTAKRDYMKTGFHARTRAEEVRCPDLELNVLQDIQDVTQDVHSAGTAGMNTADKGQAERAKMSQLEADCNKSTGLRCDVVTLYSGGMYHLYKYKKYTDVRLVFAPEYAIAQFGGDTDNFEFPRHTLDTAFFRVYEDDKPVELKEWLHWTTAGVKPNDLVFMSGHPGSTARLNTLAQLDFLRETSYPLQLKWRGETIKALHEFADKSAENHRITEEKIFG